MAVNKYDYEAIAPNGSKYGYVLKGDNVVVYVNDEKWGSPQGERFIIALLNELIQNKGKLKKDRL